jgi:hypothetical protein
MKYMLMFIDAGEGMPQTPEGQAVYARIGEWFGRLNGEGKMVSGEELQPVRTATTVRLNGGKPVVTDGPFIESKETVGGFAVIEVADLDEAIEWAKTWPGGGPVEVRPVVEHSEGM